MGAADAFPLDRFGVRAARNRESLAAGTRLDDFEILRTIGSGGFGTVYLARDLALDREVAIKEYLPAQLAYRARGLHVAVRSPELAAAYVAGLKSFINEAKILARFSHPAVVKVHHFWEANGTAYMVMPHVRGPTLRDVRRSMKAAPTEAWLRAVLDPLLDALAMLHAEGIYHRDIAPDNVLLPSPHEPVLLDFGAARRVIGDRSQTFTAVLKPSFAPIEQYAEAHALRQGPWTDLYALGAVVVYLLKAVPPPPSTVRCVHDEMTPLTHHAPPGVSATFLSAIHWALAVRPQDRPQSVHEFCNALNGHIAAPAIRPPALDSARDVQGNAPPHAHADSATWDTTIRLGSAPPPMIALPSRRPAMQPRALLVAATASVALMAGAVVALLRDMQVQPHVDTWRALAVQAAATAEEDRVPAPVATTDARPAPPAGVVPVGAPLARTPTPPMLQTVAATSTGNVVSLLPPVSQRAISASAKPPEKRTGITPAKKTQAASRIKSAKPVRLGPRELCSDRSFFAMGLCIHRKCEEPKLAKHPQCVQLREQREERSRRYDY